MTVSLLVRAEMHFEATDARLDEKGRLLTEWIPCWTFNEHLHEASLDVHEVESFFARDKYEQIGALEWDFIWFCITSGSEI